MYSPSGAYSHNNLQILSAFSMNPESGMNSPNRSQHFFTDSMMTSPGSFSTFFNLSDTSGIDNIDINDILNFDATPRKRTYDNMSYGAEYSENNGKRQHLEASNNIRVKVAPKNEDYHRTLNLGFVKVNIGERIVMSCFIGNCRYKTYTSDQFEKHLNYFHENDRNILRGFCMTCENFDCGVSIFEEFQHLYGHLNAFKAPKNIKGEEIHIKKEIECDIMEESGIDQDETIVSNVDYEDHAATFEDLPQESEFSLDNTQIIPMEPERPPNKKNTEKIFNKIDNIKEEALPVEESAPIHEDLNATIKINYDQIETRGNANLPKVAEEDLLNPIFKNPKKTVTQKTKESLRKRAFSTFVDREKNSEDDSVAKKSAHTTENISSKPDELSESLCLEFISKKIEATKNKEIKDKFENFKPNESILDLVKRRSNRLTEVDDKLKEKFSKYSEKRKNFTVRRESLRSRKSESDDSDKDSSKRSRKSSVTSTKSSNESDSEKNSPKSSDSVEISKDDKIDISFSNISIDNVLEKIKNSVKSKMESKNLNIQVEDLNINVVKNQQQSRSNSEETRSASKSSTEGQQEEKVSSRTRKSVAQPIFDDDMIVKDHGEKTPKKIGPKKIKRNSEKAESSGRKGKSKTGSELKPAIDDIENGHPKYQEKPKNPKEATAQEPLKESTSFNDKSSSSLDKSLNTSSRAIESTKYLGYTVDIEALMSKASSNLEFISIQSLYPWINESITSAIFKTKSSINILLNEICLFSTYKCMNELCYYFTTDFEEFKKHSKTHDAINNYCSFCLKNFDKPCDLCNHLELAHKFDRFQCNKCMYRSCQKGYVDIHQKFHHEKEDNCEVFKSPVQKLLKSDRSKSLPALQKNREKLVMPYRCKTPRCKEIFYSKDNFRKHLEVESNKQNCQEFVPLICQQLYAIDHSKGSNNTEGVFQCLHCQYGTDDSNIFEHMALNHPHDFAYACKRVKPQKLVELNIVSSRETIENSTSIEYIGTTTTEAKSFEGKLEDLNSVNLIKGGKSKKSLVVSEVVSIDD